jgi:hypothetical protein
MSDLAYVVKTETANVCNLVGCQRGCDINFCELAEENDLAAGRFEVLPFVAAQQGAHVLGCHLA